jgi:hypothetical protein
VNAAAAAAVVVAAAAADAPADVGEWENMSQIREVG